MGKRAIFQADITPSLPNTPSDLAATDNNNKTRVTLQWKDNASNETGFKVERTSDILKSFTEIATIPANTINYTDATNFITNQRYYYRIRAYNSSGVSDYSKIGTPTRQEQFDILTGIGDFERYHIKDTGQEVADGWTFAGTVTSTDKAIATKETGVGIAGSNRQKFGIKGTTDQQWVYLTKSLKLGEVVRFGDTLTFKAGQIQIYDSTDLPMGATASYFMRISLPYGNYSTWPTVYFKQDFQSSEINYSIPQVADLPDGVNPANFKLNFQFLVMVTGDIGTNQPTLAIDGASVLVSRGGAPLNVEVPVPRNRTINTQITFYYQDTEPYEIASQYDGIMSAIIDDNSIYHQIRYYNPNIKVYAYTIPGTIQDWRTPQYGDPQNHSTAASLGFADTIDNHPGWLYKYDVGFGPIDDRRESFPDDTADRTYKKFANDSITPLNFIFDDEYQDNYYTRMADASFQLAWREKVKNALANDYFDGVFLDSLNIAQEMELKIGASSPSNCTKTNEPEFQTNCLATVNRMPYEVQNFIHATASYFKANKLETMSNQIGQYLQRFIGRSYYDPYWNPATESNPEDVYKVPFDPTKYSVNTPDNTYDNIFVEHAYITFWWVKDPATNNYTNLYDLSLWKDSIANIEMVNGWNQTLPEGKKKKIWQLVYNVDCKNCTVHDPMEGQDGWARFGLTSYLLSSNEYSYLGVSRREPYNNFDFGYSWFFPYDPGYNLTAQLSEPLEGRVVSAAYPDKSLQSRQFTNGMVVVNGHDGYARDGAGNIIRDTNYLPVVAPEGTYNRTYTLTQPMMDDDGRTYPAGYKLVLKPHSGRIFFLPVEIGGISVSGVTPNSANVQWSTNKLATGKINFGTTSTMTGLATINNFSTKHNMQITKLKAKTKYYFKVISQDSFGTTKGSAMLYFTTLSPVKITKFHYNAKGIDRRHLNDEYVVVKNIGNTTINLKGWILKNRRGRKSTIKANYYLKPSKSVTIHSGRKWKYVYVKSKIQNPKLKGKRKKEKVRCYIREANIYLHRYTELWNNRHDTMRLYSKTKKLMLKKSY